MKLLVAIAPEGYRDEELEYPAEAFRNAGIGFDIASTKTGTCTGMLGGRMQVSLTFDRVNTEGYTGIVVIGGAGSPAHLWGNRDLLRLTGLFYESKKIVAAICLAPVVLARAGILRGKKVTFFRTRESIAEIIAGGGILSDDPVVVHGCVITANGPGSAKAFGDAIVSALMP